MKRRGFSKCVAGLPYLAAGLLWALASLAGAEGAATVAVYRYYLSPTQTHLYSTSPAGPGAAGWQPEGVAFYVSPVQLPYTVPLYGVYKAKLADHFYTVDAQAKNYCISSLGYADQGVLGYVLPAQRDIPGSAPLYRWVRARKWTEHPGLGEVQDFHIQDHFYQTSSSAPANYTSEGVECRVWTSQVSLPQTLLQIDSPAPGQPLQVGQTATIGWRVWSGGGYIRFSFSRDNGSAWQAIKSVASAANFGVMNTSSFVWTVPAAALNKVQIRADWTKDTGGSAPPWATATTGALNVDSATTPAPNAPILTAAVKGNKQVDLSWTSGSAGVTGFSVERKTQGGAYGIVITLGKSASAYADTSLAPGTTYVYRIRAWIGAKPSSGSNEVTLTIPRLRLAPARKK